MLLYSNNFSFESKECNRLLIENSEISFYTYAVFSPEIF